MSQNNTAFSSNNTRNILHIHIQSICTYSSEILRESQNFRLAHIFHEILLTLNIKIQFKIILQFSWSMVSNDYFTTPITRSIEIIHLEGLSDTCEN